MPTTWGSRLLRDYVPPRDELPVAKLRATGAVIVGKTNVPEFATQGVTDNLLIGPTRNPWNLALTPGGSSGGAAAAVAAGCTPIALVTDGGGSTRRPASHCGLVGFKPSHHWVPRGGGVPEIFLDYEAIGGLARSVEDVRLLMTACGATRTLADLRPSKILYVPRFGRNPVDPSIAAHTLEAVKRLQSLGHAVADGSAQEFDLADDINRLWPRLSAAGLAWLLGQRDQSDQCDQHDQRGHRGPWQAAFGSDRTIDLALCTPGTQALVESGRGLDASALFELLMSARKLAQRLDEDVFARDKFDFMLTPCTAALAWPVGETHPSTIAGEAVGARGHAVFTALANAAGLPAIALPTGLVDGVPTGIQLIGRRWSDARLVALASAWEAAYPFTARPGIGV